MSRRLGDLRVWESASVVKRIDKDSMKVLQGPARLSSRYIGPRCLKRLSVFTGALVALWVHRLAG